MAHTRVLVAAGAAVGLIVAGCSTTVAGIAAPASESATLLAQSPPSPPVDTGSTSRPAPDSTSVTPTAMDTTAIPTTGITSTEMSTTEMSTTEMTTTVETATSRAVSARTTATVANGVISVGSGKPKASIDQYEDFLCPVCGAYEKVYGDQLVRYADSGKLRINIHMMNILDLSSHSKTYSSRAAAALLAVAELAGNRPGVALNFHSALYRHQPAENGGTDFSDTQLADLAIASGAPASVRAAIVSGKYLSTARAAALAFEKQLEQEVGQVGTPTVLHNREPVDLDDPGWISAITG